MQSRHLYHATILSDLNRQFETQMNLQHHLLLNAGVSLLKINDVILHYARSENGDRISGRHRFQLYSFLQRKGGKIELSSGLFIVLRFLFVYFIYLFFLERLILLPIIKSSLFSSFFQRIAMAFVRMVFKFPCLRISGDSQFLYQLPAVLWVNSS